jgi:hypothetical protein
MSLESDCFVGGSRFISAESIAQNAHNHNISFVRRSKIVYELTVYVGLVLKKINITLEHIQSHVTVQKELKV